MPKRTNSFQRVIKLVHDQVSTSAVVTESKMLVNALTGAASEVDIVIETITPPYVVMISIECVARSRKADVEWVQQMVGKHQHLPTNVLVLVSERGFTTRAKAYAQKSGVRTITFEDAHTIDWAREVELLTDPIVAKLHIDFQGSAVLADGTVVKRGGDAVYRADGTRRCTLLELITQIVNHDQHRNQLWDFVGQKPSGTATSTMDAQTPGAEPWYMDADGGRLQVAKIVIALTFSQHRQQFNLKHAAFADRVVGYGEAPAPGDDGTAILTMVQHGKDHGTGRMLIVDADGHERYTVKMTPITPSAKPGAAR